MGPEDHTPEWDKQVEIITTVTTNAKPESQAILDQMLMVYTFDTSFSRSAILQARHDVLVDMAENENEKADTTNA